MLQARAGLVERRGRECQPTGAAAPRRPLQRWDYWRMTVWLRGIELKIVPPCCVLILSGTFGFGKSRYTKLLEISSAVLQIRIRRIHIIIINIIISESGFVSECGCRIRIRKKSYGSGFRQKNTQKIS